MLHTLKQILIYSLPK